MPRDINYDVLILGETFIPELGQHLQHVDADLLRFVVQTSADDTEAVWCQYPAMQLVVLVSLVGFIFLIRYLFQGNLRLLHLLFCPVIDRLQ